MIVSESHKFIFARGIKTASTSLANELVLKSRSVEQSNLYKVLRRLPTINEKYPFYDFRNHPHISFSKAKSILPSRIFDSSLKFGVVREPISWILSVYKHWLRNYKEKSPQKFGSINTLEDFILYRMDNYPPIQALQFLASNGTLLTDVLGNFHAIDSFVDELAIKLSFPINIKRLNLAPLNQHLEISHKDKTLIEKACELDYALFDFENLNTPIIRENNNQVDTINQKLKSAWIDAGGINFDPWKF